MINKQANKLIGLAYEKTIEVPVKQNKIHMNVGKTNKKKSVSFVKSEKITSLCCPEELWRVKLS